ncbi:MAG: aldo/keto reductase [Clostridia bacterium]|nr:aldo/keto reductase [Clostridia bacterium]
MIYRDFQGERLSALAFGTMRLPTVEGTGTIDEKRVYEMTEYAISHGVNYFDTAYPYHGGESERVMGRVLKSFPRQSFNLATKYPGHQISDSYDVKAVFEEQLEKCGVDYFDFYLLHNVYEDSVPVYEDSRWGIIDYLKEQKKNGRIRHLGFSSHAQPDSLKSFVERHGEDMEFCQIQLNYLDWTLQSANEKYDILTAAGIPVFVMEPVRGGKLANLPASITERLKELCPGKSSASFAFRFLLGLPNVTTVLSGMSDMAQMEDNVKTFTVGEPLSQEEWQTALDIAEFLKDAVPCTGCRYCCDGCPAGLDIPKLISVYNDVKFQPHFNAGMYIDSLDEGKKPSACIGCGACSAICPQKIDVPSLMKDLEERLSKLPKWADLCRERAEASKRGKKQ